MQRAPISIRAARPGIGDSVPGRELADRAAAGEDAAFECMMRRHNPLLFRTVRSILKSDAEVEDALQEGYWHALRTFRSESKLST